VAQGRIILRGQARRGKRKKSTFSQGGLQKERGLVFKKSMRGKVCGGLYGGKKKLRAGVFNGSGIIFDICAVRKGGVI